MQRLGVEQVSQPVVGGVGVADVEKDHRLFCGQLPDIDLLLILEQGPGAVEGERGQLLGQDAQNAAVHLIRPPAGLGHFIAHGREAVRGELAQLLHKPVEVSAPRLPKEPGDTAKVVLLFGCDAAKLIIKNQQKNGEIG